MAQKKYLQWLEKDALVLLEGWARDGLTDEQIAHNAGISVKTLYEWKKAHPPICEALKKGKEVVDFEVESALLKKCKAGDTIAIIFWLKNRRPDKWRDKPVEAVKPAQAQEADGLSKSLAELAKGLESDD